VNLSLDFSVTHFVTTKTMTMMCREQETDILKEQIEKLNVAIMKEEEKAHDLETKARYVSRTSVYYVFKRCI